MKQVSKLSLPGISDEIAVVNMAVNKKSRSIEDPTGNGIVFKLLQPGEQNERFEELLSFQDRLDQCVLDGAGIDRLIEILAQSLQCTVVFEDSALARRLTAFHEIDKNKAEQLMTRLSVKTAPAIKSALNCLPPKQACTLSAQVDGIVIHRLFYPVYAGNERLGFLSLLRTKTPFSDGVAIALKRAAGVIAILLAHNRRIAEIELRLKGNFVEDLIAAKAIENDSIINRALALNYDITLPHRVLVATIDNLKQHASHFDQKQYAEYKTALITKIQYVIDQKAAGMAIFHGDEIIMLLQQKDGSITGSKKLAEEIAEDVFHQNKAKLYIGIGNSCAGLADFRDSYLTAKKALDIGEFMITEGNVRSFEQFKIHALFLSTLKPEELYGYAKSQLKPLLDYDAKHKAELLKTLQEFLYLRNNVEGTAKSLNMSVSGLKYRLQKIEKIIGNVLKDNKVCFDLQLALIILQLFGEYKIDG
jgi:purine catabolism regulator